MGEASETIEMMTLDKEMAEESAEILRQENDDLKVKLEEAETDLALLREEAEVDLDADGGEGGDQSVLKMQIRIKDEENKKLKEWFSQKILYSLNIFDKKLWCVKSLTKGSIGQTTRS